MRQPERFALVKFTTVGHQQIPDIVRVIEQVHVVRSEPEVHNIAVLVGGVLEKGKPIALKGLHLPQGRQRTRPGWIAKLCHIAYTSC